MHSLTLPKLMTRRFTRSQSPSFEAFQRWPFISAFSNGRRLTPTSHGSVGPLSRRLRWRSCFGREGSGSRRGHLSAAYSVSSTSAVRYEGRSSRAVCVSAWRGTRESVARTGGPGRPMCRRASALPWMRTRTVAKCFRLGLGRFILWRLPSYSRARQSSHRWLAMRSPSR